MSVINPCLTLAVCALSAGVGRTGTFLALDQLLQQMRQEKLVDVFGVVYSLRMNRYQMIQTLVRSLLPLFSLHFTGVHRAGSWRSWLAKPSTPRLLLSLSLCPPGAESSSSAGVEIAGGGGLELLRALLDPQQQHAESQRPPRRLRNSPEH